MADGSTMRRMVVQRVMPMACAASTSPCPVSRMAPANNSAVYAQVFSAKARMAQNIGSLNHVQGQMSFQRACMNSICPRP